MTTGTKDALLARIREKKATIGIVGMGYVGLPLAMAFNDKGFPIIGFDIDARKVRQLQGGSSYIKHIPSGKIAALTESGKFEATTDFSRAAAADALLLCVPTPLTHQREPDLTYIARTMDALLPHLRPGQLLVLESTTYPGTTREYLNGPVAKRGLRAGEDFFIAFSPEREDPGNPKYSAANIPKVVGADDPASREAACLLYAQMAPDVVAVSSSDTAEAVKLLENIFRSINIALVNELKIIFNEMGIDVWEVIRAASTKPFGYMPFYPGPGLGGHCIPIDPFYLTWKAREFGVSTRFIELAGEVNTSMPHYVVEKTQEALNGRRRCLKGARLLIVGLAYKKDVDDIRESPSLELMHLYARRGAVVDYYDPYVPQIPHLRRFPQFEGIRSIPALAGALGAYDAVVVATDHAEIDYAALAREAPLVVDCRGACGVGPNVVRA